MNEFLKYIEIEILKKESEIKNIDDSTLEGKMIKVSKLSKEVSRVNDLLIPKVNDYISEHKLSDSDILLIEEKIQELTNRMLNLIV